MGVTGFIKTASADIRNIAFAVLAVVAAIGAIILVWNVRITLHNINDATTDLKDYVHAQKAQLEDPRNKKALDAAIQVGAVFNATGRLLNTQTVPRINKELDALRLATQSIQPVANNAADFIAHTDHATNQEVLPQLVASIKSMNKLVQDTDGGVVKLLADGSVLVESTNTRTNKLLDDFDVVTVGDNGLQGLVKKGNYIEAQAGEAVAHVNHTLGVVDKKVTAILDPPPCHGFGCAMKKYLLRPITVVGAPAYLVERILYGVP